MSLMLLQTRELLADYSHTERMKIAEELDLSGSWVRSIAESRAEDAKVVNLEKLYRYLMTKAGLTPFEKLADDNSSKL